LYEVRIQGYHYIENDSTFIVRKPDSSAYINFKGEILFPFVNYILSGTFEDYGFINGVENRVGLIDKKGEIIISPKYVNIYHDKRVNGHLCLLIRKDNLEYFNLKTHKITKVPD
jgi:WG containing repeat